MRSHRQKRETIAPRTSDRQAAAPFNQSALHDSRWPAVVAALEHLRSQGHRAIRIVDVDCGAGTLLLHALHHARAIGFVAIEGRGIDGVPALVGRARAAAARTPDPAIGVAFETADMACGLESEFDAPADILLWHGSGERDRVEDIVDRLGMAGNLVIGDGGVSHRCGSAS